LIKSYQSTTYGSTSIVPFTTTFKKALLIKRLTEFFGSGLRNRTAILHRPESVARLGLNTSENVLLRPNEPTVVLRPWLSIKRIGCAIDWLATEFGGTFGGIYSEFLARCPQMKKPAADYLVSNLSRRFATKAHFNTLSGSEVYPHLVLRRLPDRDAGCRSPVGKS